MKIDKILIMCLVIICADLIWSQDVVGGAFVQFGWAPEDRNRVEQYWGGGLVYRGLLHGRDADTCGFGIGNMTFSGDLTASLSDETMMELFYKARMGERFALQPDLQYFDSPGGQFSDSLVVGLRFEAIL